MADDDREKLWHEMDELAQRMGTHLLTLRNRREAAQQRGLLTRLAERHRKLRLRFDSAQGPEWETAKADLSREYGDLYEEFVKFEEKLDQADRNPPERAPGAKSGLV